MKNCILLHRQEINRTKTTNRKMHFIESVTANIRICGYLQPHHHELCNMAVIVIERMKFHAPIGYYPEEQLLGNEIEVTISLAIDELAGEINDELARTINYETVYDLIRESLSQPVHLLETVVTNIMLSIAEKYPTVKKIKLRVAKLNPPFGGSVKKVWVEDSWVRIIKK